MALLLVVFAICLSQYSVHAHSHCRDCFLEKLPFMVRGAATCILRSFISGDLAVIDAKKSNYYLILVRFSGKGCHTLH